MRIGAVKPATEAEGPGVRFAVWVQGCSIRCSGCFNPHLWGAEGGRAVDPLELAEQAVGAGVEGVTLLGGEPFEQAVSLAVFAAAVREAGLSVMTFSGYRLEALRQFDAPNGSEALLAATDLLIDGPFLASQLDYVRPWVGSTNQRVHFLSGRYAHLGPVLESIPDRLEFRVSADGEIAVNGWSDLDSLASLLEGTAFVPRGRRR